MESDVALSLSNFLCYMAELCMAYRCIMGKVLGGGCGGSS